MNINIRKYNAADCEKVAKLFYDTVHTVNAADYTAAQLFAWASNEYSLKNRKDDLAEQYTLIAETDGGIVGFGSIDKSGCLDLLFVHKDFQRRGIATIICDGLEKDFSEITTYASITAKPFFEKRGYVVVKSQEAERLGIKLENFVMKKTCENFKL